MAIIYILFGLIFWIWVLEVEPQDSGNFGVGRERRYILMLNKFRGVCYYNPESLYKQVSSHLKTALHTEPKDYLTATPREIEVEAMRLAGKRGIEFIHATTLSLL